MISEPPGVTLSKCWPCLLFRSQRFQRDLYFLSQWLQICRHSSRQVRAIICTRVGREPRLDYSILSPPPCIPPNRPGRSAVFPICKHAPFTQRKAEKVAYNFNRLQGKGVSQVALHTLTLPIHQVSLLEWRKVQHLSPFCSVRSSPRPHQPFRLPEAASQIHLIHTNHIFAKGIIKKLVPKNELNSGSVFFLPQSGWQNNPISTHYAGYGNTWIIFHITYFKMTS